MSIEQRKRAEAIFDGDFLVSSPTEGENTYYFGPNRSETKRAPMIVPTKKRVKEEGQRARRVASEQQRENKVDIMISSSKRSKRRISNSPGR